ncbi:ShlB/FhaC/HecB family hemolysin secretion/activation protein (plasmid) [Phormidium sp. CLA17]|uniref:ShlB/FhaC/HecB family hemolysin secretion/activation protein n=1 Tax=Leptolyngbya sp. Cla-17 TaxID=2803751 RepID=UPI001490B91C|nr:ShlB/FhaC/HecB family hemolysin secretion/activation protein [Leptolyngbya sp. Cla-17]MBM0744931.1 ShlB/FhaC/HecB family hemolysin secretion/activation protein [Leptolyngbya sp. Cla-17]
MNRYLFAVLILGLLPAGVPANAQVPNVTPQLPSPVLPRPIPTPDLPRPTPRSPPLDQSPQLLLPSEPLESQDTIEVARFEYQGNTIVSDQDLDAITAPFRGRRITFSELFKVRSAITQLYVDRGYITSAALIPIEGNEAVEIQGGVVTIQIIEGKLERIDITDSNYPNGGTASHRLAKYIRPRLETAANPILNEKKLLEALRLLQLDPLILSISGKLESGSQTGLSVLTINLEPAPTFRAAAELNNRRSPTVGTLERRVQLTQANLLGLGDGLQIGYANTNGSNEVDIDYTIPVSLRNATVSFRYSTLFSRVIEEPFDDFDIQGNSRIYELTFRQPIIRTATAQSFKEFAIGITASRLESDTSLLGVDFPLSAGADDSGKTRISALRVFQEYTQRSNRQVLLVRSQFSFGLDVLGATTNSSPPDSRFFVWRGQVAFLQRLGSRPYLLLRSDLQLADRPLVPLEQFSIGGLSTVRGYRQDALLGDSGVVGSIELHYPAVSTRTMELQLIPFLDVGYVWSNQNIEFDRNTLASLGLGVQWTWGNLIVNLSYGVPLIPIPRIGDTLQENGLNASIKYIWAF